MKLLAIFSLLCLCQTATAQADFQTCYTLEQYRGIWPQYYQTEAGFQGGLYELKKQLLFQDLDFSKAPDGYYTIRFLINCKGELGAFEALATDTNYQEIDFDPGLSERLIRTLTALSGWQSGKQGNGMAIDSQKFVTFVVADGEWKDLVPK